MDAKQLKAELDALVADGALVIDRSLFSGSPANREIFAGFTDSLPVRKARLAQRGNTITLSGVGKGGLDIDLRLWLVGDDIHGQLSIRPGKPLALGSFLKKIGYREKSEDKTRASELILRSIEDSYSFGEYNYPKGLSFIHSCPISGPLSGYRKLLGKTRAADLLSQLEKADDNPISGFSKPIAEISLGSLNAGLGVCRVEEGEGAKSGSMHTCFRLELELAGEPLVLISEPLTEDVAGLVFEGLDEALALPLSSAATLFRGKRFSFEKVIPAEYLTDRTRVDRFQCLLSPFDAKIEQFNLGLSTRFEKVLVADRLGFRIARLELTVDTSAGDTDVSLSIEGEIDLGDITLLAMTTIPSTHVEVRLAQADEVSISKLLGSLIPSLKLPDIRVTDIKGQVDYVEGDFILECSLASDVELPVLQNLPRAGARIDLFLARSQGEYRAAILCATQIAGSEVDLGASLGDEIELSGEFRHLDLAVAAKELLQVELKGFPDIKLPRGSMVFSDTGEFLLGGVIDLDFSALLGKAGIPLPAGIGDFTVDIAALSGNFSTKDWKLKCARTHAIPLFGNAQQAISIASASLELESAPKSGLVGKASLALHGKTAIAEDVVLEFEQVAMECDSGAGSWKVEGDIRLVLQGEIYPMTAEIGSDTFKLGYAHPIRLGSLGAGGRISIGDLSIFVDKVENESEAQYQWGLGGTVDIDDGQYVKVQGSLSLQTGPKGSQLKVSAKAPRLPRIPLPLGGEFGKGPELSIRLDDLTLAYAGGEEDSSWQLGSAAQMQILNIPPMLKQYLPGEPLQGELLASGDKLSLGFDWPSTLRFSKLGLKFASGKKLNLGTPRIDIRRIELELGDRTELVQSLEVTLPDALDYLFGRKPNGKPRLQLFNRSFTAELVLGEKLGLRTTSSPLKPLEYVKVTDSDQWWTEWDFGDYGHYQFQVPEFEYSKARWQASGGFKRLGKFKLPLIPLKLLLEACRFPDAFDKAIPDSIELEDIDLTDRNFRSHIHGLLGKAGKRMNKSVARVLDEALTLVEKVIDLCPGRLREYFVLRIPESFEFDISVDSTGGGTSASLRVLDDADPIKVLLPFMTTTPELLGLSFRGLSFGQTSGGSLLEVRYDGHVDRFNLIELSAALALAGAENKPVELSNRWILHKTKFLLPTGFPIPVPIFFDELGLEYRDIFGTELQTHWYYPDPEWSLGDYLKMLVSIYDFCTKKKYLLHEDGFGDTLNTNLTIGSQALKLPFFLGGAELKPDTHMVSINTADCAARVLDSLKTGNMGYAIEAVPLRVRDTWIRVGSEQIKFGILEMNANWCIATQREYEQTVLPAVEKDPKLARALSQDVLQQLPEGQREAVWNRGFIVILGAEVGLAGIAGLQGQFGLALTGGRESSPGRGGKSVTTGGFETGFLLAGTIAEVLKLQIDGHVVVEQKLVQLDGAIGLYWQDRPLIKTESMIKVTDTDFSARIRFILTPYFQLEGLLVIGASGFLMRGEVELAGATNAYTLKIDNAGVHIGIEITLLEFSGGVEVSCPGRDGGLFGAVVTVHPGDLFNKTFTKSIKSMANSIADQATEQAYAEVEKAMQSFDGMQLDIPGLRKTVPGMCDTALRAISSGINGGLKDVSSVFRKAARSFANDQARPFRNRINRIKTVAQKTPNERFRPEMKAALLDLLNNNSLTIRKFKITFYSRKQVITGNELKLLQTAVKYMDKLPDRDGPTLQKEYLKIPEKKRMMAEIKKEVDGAIPVIKGISFDTDLRNFLKPGIDAHMLYSYHGKDRSIDFKLNLSDMPAATKSILDALG